MLDSFSLDRTNVCVRIMDSLMDRHLLAGVSLSQLVVFLNAALYKMTFTNSHQSVNDCGSLESPTNGGVVVTGTTVGSTANYFCNKGFELTSSSTRTCQNNGIWSSKAPACRRK